MSSSNTHVTRPGGDTALAGGSESVVTLFERQADRNPGAPAIVWSGALSTYRELDLRANRVAGLLGARGLGADDPVAVCARRTPDLVAGLLGVLKAGTPYVPLDPAYPRDRITHMLSDSRASVLLAEPGVLEDLPPFGGERIPLDFASGPLAATGDARPGVRPAPETLAYVIYTSGSTGKPKGVAVTHGNLTAFLDWVSRAFTPGELSAVLASTSVCFDLSVFELFGPLSLGGCVVLADNALALGSLSPAVGVTLVNTVPSAMAELTRASSLPPTVRTVNLAGEALARAVAERVHAQPSVEVLWNLYGPTEATVYATAGRVAQGEGGAPTIGRPIANTRVHLVDARFHPVPDGAEGELLIGGSGLARGYLGRPDLTAERFVPDPFGPPGGRLYRTGDLARQRPDGEIEFLGRSDHQVKIRGFRIELGEVEESLRGHPGVREAVVVATGDPSGEDRTLAAYIAPVPGAAPRVAELRNFLKRTLPEHMVPSLFVTLEKLPRTLNGKVDRAALPAPSQARPELSSSYVSARNGPERTLVKLWEDLLKIAPIGVEDDFFELGGHSLQAARLFAQIERAFRRDLPPTILFHAATIAELARLLLPKPRKGRWTSLVPIQPQGTQRPLFGIHGGAGTILIFHKLARCLGMDQPFYGLQAQGIYGGATPHTRIEEMAAHYVREIQSVQPRGPYDLLGFCAGGLVAFEMARQLLAAGEEIGLLAGINASGPGSVSRAPSAAAAFQRKVAHHQTASRSLGGLERVAYFARAARHSAASRFPALLRRLIRVVRAPAPRKFRNDFYRFAGESIRDYAPPDVFPGVMVHFRSEAIPSEPEYAAPDLRWTGLAAGGLEFHVVPGIHPGHRTIMDEPAVFMLAAQLTPVLAEARAASGPRHSPAASARA